MSDLSLSRTSQSENGIAAQASSSNGAGTAGAWGTSLADHLLWPEFLEQLAENRRADLERDLAEYSDTDDVPAGQ